MVESTVRALRAAIVILLHTGLAALIVTSIHYFETYLHYLDGGEKLLVFDRFPLRYLFQTIDLGVIVAFGWNGIKDVFKAFGGEE